MKNIQIIDGADNCVYDIFAATDEEYQLIFGDQGVDLLFYEDIAKRRGCQRALNGAFRDIWKRPVEKRDVVGIHGTIFYEQYWKKELFPDGFWQPKTSLHKYR